MSWDDFVTDVESRIKVTGVCPVCKLIDSVSPEDAAKIEAVLDNPQASARSIYAAFKKRGIGMDRDMINPHRRGECS